MKLLVKDTNYSTTIQIAERLQGTYDKPVIFHAYWNGIWNEKHYLSLLSCHRFHPSKNYRIFLWFENNIPNEWNDAIATLDRVECRPFILKEEITDPFVEPLTIDTELHYYSDLVRYLLLYKYGGCWFDLDVFFLRPMDPLFSHFGNEICVYQWEKQPYPNNAIYFSLTPYSASLRSIIEYIQERGQGWGFKKANLTYNLPLDIMVLPCSWFDGGWIPNPYLYMFHGGFFDASDKIWDYSCFFPGAFCYHWHNQWDKPIAHSSIIKQLSQRLPSLL